MSQFYARYVPPSRSSAKLLEVEPTQNEKRRRADAEIHETKDDGKRKKRRKVAEVDLHDDKKKVAGIQKGSAAEAEETSGGKTILDKYSISRYAKSQDSNVRIDTRKKLPQEKATKKHGAIGDDRGSENNTDEHLGITNDSGAAETESKHVGVLSKYKKSKRRSDLKGREDTNPDKKSDGLKSSEQLKQYGLVPIPQPENTHIESKTPTYSTLASWQATATKVTSSAVSKLDDLDLDNKLLNNLRSKGFQEMFPVQSTVIPLLLRGKQLYSGDLCVSAATGSGKTLAYVVPIVESLIRQESSGLQAVIVVPTRELVKQVRETCEICVSGSSLTIATALGSKSLNEEQKSLVVEEQVYDPDAYQKELEAPMDWRIFSLEKTLLRAQTRDPDKVVNYVTRRRIKANILITTPGRLVDHLQNTDGFHLDDVNWLVIDEADRLLNESYQEWIDVVVPALLSRRATQQQDEILSRMRMDLPPRIVRKVLLSATMTRDISKLNRIGLDNPKLVVLDSAADKPLDVLPADERAYSEEPVPDSTGKYVLPTSLREVVVAFKEGSDKPLLLLQMFDAHMKMRPARAHNSRLANGIGSASHLDSDADTDTDTSESEAESTSSSGDSDSDTEADSDTTSLSSNESEDPEQKSDRPSSQRQASRSEQSHSGNRVLVFTRSTASASRLSRLLSIISPTLAPSIATLTRSTASSASSRKALSSFRSGKTPILIATDRASRGIDVPGLENVISYDVPGSALTYVHRVGRTARAGREGTAWTMVEHREGRWFWNEIGGKSNECMIQRTGKIQKLALSIEDEGLKKKYEQALQTLGSEVRGERD